MGVVISCASLQLILHISGQPNGIHGNRKAKLSEEIKFSALNGIHKNFLRMASKELNVLLPITYYILVSEDTLDVLKQTTLYTKDTNKRIMVLSKSFSSQPSPNDAPPGRGVEHVKDDGLSLLNLLESVCQEPEVVAKWTVFVDKTVYIKAVSYTHLTLPTNREV